MGSRRANKSAPPRSCLTSSSMDGAALAMPIATLYVWSRRNGVSASQAALFLCWPAASLVAGSLCRYSGRHVRSGHASKGVAQTATARLALEPTILIALAMDRCDSYRCSRKKVVVACTTRLS